MNDILLNFLEKYEMNDSQIEILTYFNELEGKIPQYWINAFSKETREEKCLVILNEWEKYLQVELNNTLVYLKENLQDVKLVKIDDEYSLIYIIKTLNSLEELYYEGKNPLQIQNENKILSKFYSDLPVSLKSFYENIHNGFYYYASKSMGLNSIENIVNMSDYDWEFLELIKGDEFKIESCFGFFSNGFGDYIVLDLQKENPLEEALFWSKDEVPKLHINFWDFVDEWIVLGFEE